MMGKDLRFIDDSIGVSNVVKKKALLEVNQGGLAVSKIPKKVKNLRYFLRKKRNIVFKQSPSQIFSRSVLNTTFFDMQQVNWTVELIFYKRSSNLSLENS